MKKHTLFTTIALTVAVCLVVCAPQSKAFGYTDDLTDYGWNVLKDGANFYWSFNEAGATDWAVESSRGQVNDQLEAKAGATRVASKTANLGQAASFDGDASTFHADNLGDGRFNGAWAVEMWFQNDIVPNVNTYLFNLLGSDGSGDVPALIYGFTPSTIELWALGVRTGTAVAPTADTDWHHFAVTYYGNSSSGVADRIDLTLDGNTVTVPGGTTPQNMAVDAAINLGRWTDYGDQDAFDGQIDEVAIYNLSGMTETEIAAKTAVISGHRNLVNDSPNASLALIDPATVTYTVSPDGVQVNTAGYADTGGVELSDGLFANGAGDLSDPNSMAFYDPVAENDDVAEVIFDLGATKTLDSVWIDYLDADAKWGVNSPESFEVAFSTDGTNYSGDVLIDDIVGEGAGYFQAKRAIAEAGDVDAQYVRLRVTKNGTFAFLSEVSFIEALDELLAGDANGDGSVDVTDLGILATNYGASGTFGWSEGDFTGDGLVNVSDLGILATNYGTSAAQAVPEPSTIILLAGLLSAFCMIRRKR